MRVFIIFFFVLGVIVVRFLSNFGCVSMSGISTSWSMCVCIVECVSSDET